MIIDSSWLEQAVADVANGLADKLVKGNMTVYKHGTIVRVDIKTDENCSYDDYSPNDFDDMSLVP